MVVGMPNNRMRRAAVMLSCLALLAINAELHAQETRVTLDPKDTKIGFTLSASFHTVHGNFQLKSGTIQFNPATGAASGVIVADATSAETGNQSRDRKMHAAVLESEKYPEVVFRPSKIVGSLALAGDSTVQVEGLLRLHGTDHPLTLTMPVQISGGRVTASTRFTVPYVSWGLKNPSTLFLHVSDKVELQVTTSGRIAP